MLLVENYNILEQYSMFDDDYIEKMANYYTSDATKKRYPHLEKIPFYEWLCVQYSADFKTKSRLLKTPV